ncbi:MAG: TIGR04211 family SH3 domain-containing protein [Myxococcota bacterium]
MATQEGAHPARVTHPFHLSTLLWIAVGIGLLFAAPATAQQAWVKDELRLNLRSGAGTQFRIKGVVTSGDEVTVLAPSRNGWTKVRVKELGEGWIPEGFLQEEPTAGLRLAKSESETAEFRSQFTGLTERVKELETTNAELAGTDAGQRAEIETLTRENLELKAGARWPEWITGAGILTVGMVMGAALHSLNGRRSRPRIRL